LNVLLTAEFVDTPDGRLFIAARWPGNHSSRRAVVVVPALADEMNKSRKLVTELGCALAQNGVATVIPDLIGTGDSEGSFEDASVALWLRNLDEVADWGKRRGIEIDAILGVRFGCLLAALWTRTSECRVRATAFWQPTPNGEQIVRQWIRLRVSAAMFDGGSKVSSADLEQHLTAGQSLEIGGYLLTNALAQELRALELSDLIGPNLGRLHLFEVGEGAQLTPAIRRLASVCSSSEPVRVQGAPFWSATEIVLNPELVTQTLQCLVGEVS